MPRCSFSFLLAFILLLIFSETPESVVWCLTSIWGKFSVLLFQIFLHSSFFFFWHPDFMNGTSLVGVPQLIDILFHYFQSFFSSYFFLEVSMMYSHVEIISSAMSCLLLSPSKTLSVSITVFFISSISFQFFLMIVISLLTLPLFSCVLSALFTSTLEY